LRKFRGSMLKLGKTNIFWKLHYSFPFHSLCLSCYHSGSISPTYLCTAFMHVDPKSVNIQSSGKYLFTFLESTHLKAARKMLRKLTLCLSLFFLYLSFSFTLFLSLSHSLHQLLLREPNTKPNFFSIINVNWFQGTTKKSKIGRLYHRSRD